MKKGEVEKVQVKDTKVKAGLTSSAVTGMMPGEDADEIRLLEAGAAQGMADAAYHLGVKLLAAAAAHGVPELQTKAVESLRQAADAGHIEACNRLGECYLHGEAVEQDMLEVLTASLTLIVALAILTLTLALALPFILNLHLNKFHLALT